MIAVSPQTATALRAAMTRLLDGQPERCDGALTIANLAREAGVSRATANRDTSLIAAFRQAIRSTSTTSDGTPAALRERIRRLESDLAARKRDEHAELVRLRQTVHVLAQHVQALTLDNEALRQSLAAEGRLRTLPTSHTHS